MSDEPQYTMTGRCGLCGSHLQFKEPVHVSVLDSCVCTSCTQLTSTAGFAKQWEKVNEPFGTNTAKSK